MREINTIFTMSLNHRVLYIVSSLSFDNNPYQLRKMKKKKEEKILAESEHVASLVLHFLDYLLYSFTLNAYLWH